MKQVVGKWFIRPSENRITHIDTDESVKLEPRAMEVLSYFVKNPGRVISRDELIEQVWGGRIVGDHAIYRVINQIRKALDPNDKDAYLTTIAKKGYKLNQTVEAYVENLPIVNDSHDLAFSRQQISNNNKKSYHLMIFGLLGFALLSIFGLWRVVLAEAWEKYATKTYAEFAPLNTLEIEKDYPKFSTDGQKLMFTLNEDKNNNHNIYYQDIESRKIEKLVEDGFNNIKPVASNDMGVVVYQKMSVDNCTIVALSKKDNFKMKELFSCVGNENMDYEISSDGKFLYHTFKDQVYKTSRIFSYNINNGNRELISKEIGNDYIGDTEVSLSPSDKKLIYIRQLRKKNKTTLVLYDLENHKEIELRTFNNNIRGLDWLPDSENVVFLYDLSMLKKYSIKYDFEIPIVSSIKSKLEKFDHSPIEDQVAIVDTSFKSQIYELELDQNCIKGLCSTSSPEIEVENVLYYFPLYSNKSDLLAFISRRSGQQEIWLKDSSGEIKQLTQFEDKEIIVKYTWSPDDKFILINAIDDVFIVDLLSSNIDRLQFPNAVGKPFSAEWGGDSNSLVITSDHSNGFNAYHFNLKTKKLTNLEMPGVAKVLALSETESVYFYKNKPGLWRNFVEPKLMISELDYKQYYRLSFKDESIYFSRENDESGTDIILMDSLGNKNKLFTIDANFYQFSLSENNRLAFSEYTLSSKDITLVTPD